MYQSKHATWKMVPFSYSYRYPLCNSVLSWLLVSRIVRYCCASLRVCMLCVLSASDGSFFISWCWQAETEVVWSVMKEPGELFQITEGQNYQGFRHHSHIDCTDQKMTVLFLTVELCNIRSETGVHSSKIPASPGFLWFIFLLILQYKEMRRWSKKQNNMSKNISRLNYRKGIFFSWK